MSYREILAYVSTGDAAPRISNYAAALASLLRAKLVGLIVETDVIDLGELDRAILDKERQDAFERLAKRKIDLHDEAVRTGAVFESAAKQRGVQCDTIYKTGMPADIPEMVMEAARLCDCSILPASEEIGGFQIAIVEEVLFGSGRPLVILPRTRPLPESLNAVCVAWDGSRPATRAVHDALPILRLAPAVEVVTIADEKPLDKLPSGHDLVRHLKAHEINARCHEVRFDGTPVGEQIMKTAVNLNAEMLVMGAYGHSRVRQIVFGGATRTVLHDPFLPTLMSC